MTVTECRIPQFIGERHGSRTIQTLCPSCFELHQVEYAAGLTVLGTTGCLARLTGRPRPDSPIPPVEGTTSKLRNPGA